MPIQMAILKQEKMETLKPHKRKKLLILILAFFLGCKQLPVDGSYEISLLEPFKANVYIESIQDLKEADYYITLHVVDADQEIDTQIKVDFKQLQNHGYALPRNRFGIELIKGGFMFQITDTVEEFNTLQYIHEQKHTAVIVILEYPFVHTDIGKFNYEKFFEDRASIAPDLSVGDVFYPTVKNQEIRSINY